MGRRFVAVLAVATMGCASGAQSVGTAAAAKGSPAPVLNVVVEDQDGHPVRGLKAQNFRVTEGGEPRTIARLEEFSSQDVPAKAPTLPSLPPGTFTNYTPFAPGETLNILLIDALNTPLKGEGFIRSQLLQYVRHANPNTRIAIFGLANHLILLQGYTSDPSALRDVLERKLIARVPAVVDPSGSSTAASPGMKGSASSISLAANLRAFEGSFDRLETDFRVPLTLDAFNTLAHTLAAFPGRKNLIWFSASFPFNLVPDPLVEHPFRVADAEEAELRETVALLAKAQVAVYPVDARNLMNQPSGKSAPAGQTRAYELGKTAQSPTAEHAMMDAIAVSTGGRAFGDATSLADAVHSAIAAGSNYYSLTYSPAGSEKENSYRPVQVDVIGVDAGHLQLFYRRGDLDDGSTTSPAQDRAAAYAHAAMRRGSPEPEDLLFRVRVLPAAATTDTVLAPDNQLDPDLPANGPFRRYDVDFLSLPSQVIFTEQLDGNRVAKVDFLAYVYDIEGNLLDTTGQTLTIQPKTNDEARLARSFIHCHLEVSVPDYVETFLRIGMRDATSNRLGAVEIPTSIVSFLPPATSAPAPHTTPKPAGR
jgi:VWFA-related protein